MNVYVYETFTIVFMLFGLLVGSIVLVVVGLPLMLNHWRNRRKDES